MEILRITQVALGANRVLEGGYLVVLKPFIEYVIFFRSVEVSLYTIFI